MDVKINNINITKDTNMHMITFNHIPTVLSIKGSVGSGYSSYALTIGTGKDLEGNEYVKFGNSTLTATNDVNEAVNSIFYMSSTASSTIMAYYLAKALNSTSESASYNIYSLENKVYIESKEVGFTLDNIETNISGFFTVSKNTSTTSNELDNSKIIVNIFNDDKFVASLAKNAINSECKFDLSPILIANTKEGELFNYNIKISQLTTTNNVSITEANKLYSTNGYSVNQGKYYLNMLDMTNNFVLLQNISRGEERDVNNNTILYCAEPSITLSLANITDATVPEITVNYLDSLYGQIATETLSGFTAKNKIYNCTLNLNKENFEASTYVDVVLPTNQTIRYNVIKPLKYSDITSRVYWYNSYGGISFFDFTGSRTEERKTEKSTYKKSNLSLYENKQKSLDKIYSNELEYEVTLTTHMIERDGLYSLYDLVNSYHAWIVINGEENEIIVTDFKINESQNNNIYQCEIKYTYSSNDMF